MNKLDGTTLSPTLVTDQGSKDRKIRWELSLHHVVVIQWRIQLQKEYVRQLQPNDLVY